MTREEFNAKNMNTFIQFLRNKVAQVERLEISNHYPTTNPYKCALAQFYGAGSDALTVRLDDSTHVAFPPDVYAVAMVAGTFTEALKAAEKLQRGELQLVGRWLQTLDGATYQPSFQA